MNEAHEQVLSATSTPRLDAASPAPDNRKPLKRTISQRIKDKQKFEATLRMNAPFVCAREKADALSQIAIIGMLTFGFGVTALLQMKPADVNEIKDKNLHPFVWLMSISVCTSAIGMVIDSMMYYVLKQMIAHNQPEGIKKLVSSKIVWQINNIGQYLIWLGIICSGTATGIYFYVLLPTNEATTLLAVYGTIIILGIAGTVYIFICYLMWSNWDVDDPLGKDE